MEDWEQYRIQNYTQIIRLYLYNKLPGKVKNILIRLTIRTSHIFYRRICIPNCNVTVTLINYQSSQLYIFVLFAFLL